MKNCSALLDCVVGCGNDCHVTATVQLLQEVSQIPLQALPFLFYYFVLNMSPLSSFFNCGQIRSYSVYQWGLDHVFSIQTLTVARTAALDDITRNMTLVGANLSFKTYVISNVPRLLFFPWFCILFCCNLWNFPKLPCGHPPRTLSLSLSHITIWDISLQH